MSQEKIYTKGLFVNTPREGAPDFVMGSLSITKDFAKWIAENQQLFNEKGYLKLELKKGKEEGKGYAEVNTYGLNLDAKSEAKTLDPEPLDDGLPF